jgi:hypothetical protein
MDEETKKLITAGMLSDVLGMEIVNAYFENDGVLFPLERQGKYKQNAKGYPHGLPIPELKDKLEEWFIRFSEENSILYSAQRAYGKEWKISLTWRGYAHQEVGEAETKLEALLKLYHAVKGQQ